MLNFAITINGVLSAMMDGTLLMQELFAENLVLMVKNNKYLLAYFSCNVLGTSGGSSCCAGYGQGYVPIGIRNVGCTSSSSSLSSCTFTADSSGCSHSEDAGAYCYGQLMYNIYCVYCGIIK